MDEGYPRIASDTGDEITWEKCALCDNDAMMEFEGSGLCGMHYAEMKGWLVNVPDKDKGVDVAGAIDSMTLSTLQEDGSICCQTCGSWTTAEDMKVDGKCPLCREAVVEVAHATA